MNDPILHLLHLLHTRPGHRVCDAISDKEIDAALTHYQKLVERYEMIRDGAIREGYEGGWTGVYRLPMIDAWDDTLYARNRGQGYHYNTFDEALDARIAKRKQQS